MRLKLSKIRGLKIALSLLVLVTLIFIFLSFTHQKENLIGNSVSVPAIPINYNNFEKEMSENYVIQALPDNAKIALKFYNFNSGQRQWENSFILNRANVTGGILQNPDITLSLSSQYLKELTNTNFCQIIQKANKNGDLGMEFNLSGASLAWKYKNVLKYRSCFGM